MIGVLRAARVPLVIAVLGAGTFFGLQYRLGAYDDVYHLTVDLPRAGQLMRVGADVRQSGVLVGNVSAIRLQDRRILMTLEIEDRYRVPANVEAVVDLKTLLGDKFVDLKFDSYGEPFLGDGDRIEGVIGPELEDVLAEGVEVLGAIDPGEAATVVGELAQAARGHGEDVARGIEANAELSTTFRETLQPQIRSWEDFEVLFGELATRGDDLNDLADAINEGVPVYASARAQQQLRRVLTALTPMANDFADLLIYERPYWDRMIDAGDRVLQVIADRPQGLSDLIHGAYRYVFKLGGDPPDLPDGSSMAPFANFIGGDDSQGPSFEDGIRQLCQEIPADDRRHVPICGEVGP